MQVTAARRRFDLPSRKGDMIGVHAGYPDIGQPVGTQANQPGHWLDILNDTKVQ
jgi:hypothetical protein